MPAVSEHKESVSDDIVWGVKRGVMLALGFCLWITVLYLLKGGDVFARQHVTYGGMVAAYLGLGSFVGGIVGALRRFTTSEGGSFVVGLAAGIPIAIAITVAVSGHPKNWPPAATRLFIPVYGSQLVGSSGTN
jgi:hypothetical protein